MTRQRSVESPWGSSAMAHRRSSTASSGTSFHCWGIQTDPSVDAAAAAASRGRSSSRRASAIASSAQGSTWSHSALGRQSRARVSSRSIRSTVVPRGSRRWASIAAATSRSASTHEKVRRACAAASAAARQARPTWVGPAASQCRASSATRSSRPTIPPTAASSARVWATWAWSRASRDGLAVVTTASRVRAWVKAAVPASGSSTSPASRAGVSASSTSSTGSPATAANRSSEKRRPRTAARRSSSRVRSGRPCRRRTMTSRTVAGNVVLSRASSRASSTRK